MEIAMTTIEELAKKANELREAISKLEAAGHPKESTPESLGIEFVQIDEFEIATTPVTQRQYVAVMGNNPSHFPGEDLPVESITYDQAEAFCRRIDCRLPTETEWEVACRAGSRTNYCFGDDIDRLGDYVWFDENANDQTHDVGQKKPNAWGLYDMHGNVWEWTSSAWDLGSSARVLRGGSWYSYPAHCRSSFRYYYPPAFRLQFVGFRVARERKP